MSQLLSKKRGYIGGIDDVEEIWAARAHTKRVVMILYTFVLALSVTVIFLAKRLDHAQAEAQAYRTAWNKLFDGAQRDPDRPWPESRP